MKYPTPHPWRVTIEQARDIQQSLRERVVREDAFGPVKLVAGVDVGFPSRERARAAVAVLSFPDLEPVASAVARRAARFPYVPGYLSFREVPAVLAALEKLRTPPDLILCDGQGYAHPRRLGIACHLGVVTGIPTVGVAKTRLIGAYAEPGPHRGAWEPLHDRGEIIGAVLRSRDRVKPLFVSSGHRVSLASAIELVLRCCRRYRLPETTRAAHRLASGTGRPDMRRR